MMAQEQAQQQDQSGSEAPSPNNDSNEDQAKGDVVDAEFEEVKDKK